MNRCVLAAVAVAVAALGMVACGGSSNSPIRTVNGCEIKPVTNCAGANLAGKNLNGARLPRSDLRRANLANAALLNANLNGADLRHANLQAADLRGARLNGTKLNGANLTFAKLAKANLANADLRGALFIGADLTGAKVTRAQLAGATQCQTIGTNGVVDNSGCGRSKAKPGSSSATSTTVPLAVAPLPPLTVVRFEAPTTYSCGSGGGGGGTGGTKRHKPGGGGGGGTGGNGIVTISWSVPQAAQAIFTLDGIRPSSELTNLPAIVTNPAGQAAGDITGGTVTIAFSCDRLPHVVTFVWTQANAQGVPIPGAPAALRTATLAYAG